MAYCEECGYELTGQERFCEKCGCPVSAAGDDDSLAEDIDMNELKRSLLYKMSNGSHELFHSNVLAWMLERNHHFAGVFFKELKGKEFKVFREKNHMDIVLESGDTAYVIENKFKSLPGAYQLERYQQTLSKSKPVKQFGGGVLLGVHDLLGNQHPDGWHYVDYQVITDYITNFVNTDRWSHVDSFEKSAIIQYGQLISRLKNVLDREIDWNGTRMPMPEDFPELEGTPLQDLCKKIQTAVFARRLSCDVREGELDKYASEQGFNFKITTSFLRGDAILEVRFFKDSRDDKDQKMDDNWGAECSIGIEVHANKYMWFIKCDEDVVSVSNIKEIIGLLEKKLWFTNEPRQTASGRPQKRGYYSFGKEFKYQYLPLKDKKDFSFEFLSNLIQRKLNAAKDLLSLLNQKLK
ncbi:MAG: PD-(D/E)XK nuclease family protein [Kiritimatiellae bacterium]|nr:PD-(D/E)XK nuclease family protein [Kiritimatiellia bacterium]